MTISQRIFGIMEQKHLKQSDLANYIGVANSSVSDWKKKGSTPSADKIVKISEFLNVSIDYLLGRVDEPTATIKTVQGYITPHENHIKSQDNSLDEMSQELLKRFQQLSFDDKLEVFNYIKNKKGA